MELIKLLPDYYEKNVTMQTLQGLLSGVTNNLEQGLSSTISECFASTASKLLERYEQLLGLEVDVSKPDDFRQERIRAKISGVGTTTKEMVKNVARRYIPLPFCDPFCRYAGDSGEYGRSEAYH